MTTPSSRLAYGAPGAPAEFGPYLLFGLVARGGMAEVYRARAPGRPELGMLAIKVMRPELAREPRFIEMFIHEGELAMLLACEAIVRTVDVGEVEGRYYIAMEYIGGKDLTQVLRRCQEAGERLPVSAAIAITGAVCAGLAFAHGVQGGDGRPLGIVNRDVSPSNVRVGYDGRVKLLDFGIAQAMLKLNAETATLKGKLSYMSPEQILGLPLDARSDVFSTGILLHEMLATEKLFRGESDDALRQKVRDAAVPPPSRANPRVDAALDRVCMKALVRELPDRYQSAAELRDALATVGERYPVAPGELAGLMRGLFRADHAREAEEIAACGATEETAEGVGLWARIKSKLSK